MLRLDVCIQAWYLVLAFVRAEYPQYHHLVDLGIQLWHSGSILSDPSLMQKTQARFRAFVLDIARHWGSMCICLRTKPNQRCLSPPVLPARAVRNGSSAGSPSRPPLPRAPAAGVLPPQDPVAGRHPPAPSPPRATAAGANLPPCLHPELQRAAPPSCPASTPSSSDRHASTPSSAAWRSSGNGSTYMWWLPNFADVHP